MCVCVGGCIRDDSNIIALYCFLSSLPRCPVHLQRLISVCALLCVHACRNVWPDIIAQTVISAMHTLSLLAIIQKSQFEELKCGRLHSCWPSSVDRSALPPPQSEVTIAIRARTTDGDRHFNIILKFTVAGNYSRIVWSSPLSFKVPVIVLTLQSLSVTWVTRKINTVYKYRYIYTVSFICEPF